MVAKVTQQGDVFTLTVEIDRQTAERLRLSPDTTPSVEVDGNDLIVSIERGEDHRRKIAAALAELDEEWGPVFQKLAE